METGYKNHHGSQKQSNRKRTFSEKRPTPKKKRKVESYSDTDDIIVQIRLETQIKYLTEIQKEMASRDMKVHKGQLKRRQLEKWPGALMIHRMEFRY